MAGSTVTRRLFFALWPERALQIALAEATRDVVLASGGRPIPSDNFHVTLAFLGSVPEARLTDVVAVGAAVATEVGSLPLQVGLETLEYWQQPQVLCATGPTRSAAHSSGGAMLAGRLKANLSALGLAPDLNGSRSVVDSTTTGFRPHVTLVRKVVHPIATLPIEPAHWSFEDFALVESRRGPAGSTYNILATFRA